MGCCSNGSAVIPEHIANHPQVRVIRAPDDITAKGVGALKRFACENCLGDYFVELDHDDILTDNALQCIYDSASATKAGFLYSDFANFYADGSAQVFDHSYGWESYSFIYRDCTYTAMRAFLSNSSSLSQIFLHPIM